MNRAAAYQGVVFHDGAHGVAETRPLASETVHDRDRVVGGGKADHDPDECPPDEHVDGGRLVDFAHTLEVPYGETVDRQQMTGNCGPVAEPDPLVISSIGDQPGAKRHAAWTTTSVSAQTH